MTNLCKVRILSLDAMGTIIRLREPPATVYSRIARQEFGIVDIPTEKEMGINFRNAFRQLEMKKPCYGHSEGPLGYRNWWTEVIKRSFGTNVQIPDALSKRLIDHYATALPWDFTEPELLKALRNFHDCSPIKLVIVSNFDVRLRQILTQLGITFVDEFFLSGEKGVQKPEAEMFELVLNHFGLQNSPDALLHIGNNLEKDFKAAVHFGAQGLLYRPFGIKEEEQPIKGVHHVHSIKEFLLEISKEKI